MRADRSFWLDPDCRSRLETLWGLSWVAREVPENHVTLRLDAVGKLSLICLFLVFAGGKPAFASGAAADGFCRLFLLSFFKKITGTSVFRQSPEGLREETEPVSKSGEEEDLLAEEAPPQEPPPHTAASEETLIVDHRHSIRPRHLVMSKFMAALRGKPYQMSLVDFGLHVRKR